MESRTSSRRILVTGATGFTGGALARALSSRGNAVRTLARNPWPAAERSGIEVIQGDIADPASVDRAMEGMDTVYHLAAAYRENVPYAQLEAVNVGGTRNVLDAARRHKVKRVVHCSTAGVHGHIENPPADENAPFQPGDDYQKTKLEGELLARRYADEGDPITIFRPIGIYGPGDRRFLKLFRGIKNGTFIMFGDGAPWYHLTYIDDLVRGIIACGENPEAIGKTYLIAGPPAVTLNELVGKIAEVVGAKPPRIRLPFSLLYGAAALCEAVCAPLGIQAPLYRRRADWFRKHRSFTAAKIERELGVVPQVGLDEGLRKTAAWYSANDLI